MKQLYVILLFTIQPIWIFGQPLTYDHASPEKWFALSKEQIYLHEKQMEFKKNLSLFEEGHQKGFFYLLHTAIPRYKPYLEYPEFLELVEVDRQLYLKALERSTTLYQVALPTGFNPCIRYPLLIIFHGGNSNFQRVRNHWNEDLLENQFIKVYLQSYRHFDSETFTWRSGDRRSDGDLKLIYNEILNVYPIDTTRIVLAGMSAGATYAIGMSLRGVIPVCGFLAFCPGLPQELRSDTVQFNFRPDLRGYLLGGENDYYREHQERLTAIFDQMGVEYRYVIENGMSHQYPDDESKYIREGLHFIMKQ